MLFGLNLNEVIQTIGVIGVAAMIFAESGMMVGFFLPGDTLLFSAGFLVQTGVLPVNIHLFVLILVIAAAAGDNTGYLFGKKWGRKLFQKEESLLFHKDNLEKAEKFYTKYGPITIILSNFIPVIRTFAPIVAGISNMKHKYFAAYNLLGVVMWAGGVTYLGYYGGAFLESKGVNVESLILPVIGIAVLATVVSPFLHLLKDESRRKSLLSKFGIRK